MSSARSVRRVGIVMASGIAVSAWAGCPRSAVR